MNGFPSSNISASLVAKVCEAETHLLAVLFLALVQEVSKIFFLASRAGFNNGIVTKNLESAAEVTESRGNKWVLFGLQRSGSVEL